MTKEQLQQAAIDRICEDEEIASDELFGTPGPIRNAFRAGVEQGFDAGWKAATERVCEWRPTSAFPEIVCEASCGYEYYGLSDPDEVGMVFCPGCGGRVL